MASSGVQRYLIDIRVFHHGLNDYEMHLSDIVALSEMYRCLHVSIVGETKLVSGETGDR